MTMLQESYTTARGRRRKFTPDNIQKIKDWVAQGISREVIAKSLDVSIGSLQVTCSRLGISLRIPKMFERRRPMVSHPYIPNHPPMLGHVGLSSSIRGSKLSSNATAYSGVRPMCPSRALILRASGLWR